MTIRFWLNGILNSYAQIFFSLSKLLALSILLITFISPFLGLCGLFAIALTNFFAVSLGLSKPATEEGVYGFNALLLGLALGYEYQFNLSFVIVFISAILLLLLFTVLLQTLLGKYKLPFLGLPFLLTYWMVYLSVGAFTFIKLQEQYIFIENFVANASKSPVYIFAHSLDNIEIPYILKSYFKTLSATFFQNSVLAGILIALAILRFSRIAFSLSLIGYFGAYFWFKVLGLDTLLLTEYLIGSNFIFMAIALGGFYLIPNKWSYLSVIILTPVLCMLMVSFWKIFGVFQLKTFTLSFSILSIIFIFFLNQRWLHKYLYLTIFQYYKAEKTLYKNLITKNRFRFSHLAKLTLPFWGEWKVSQGYNGTITHIGNWGKALDFVIVNEKNLTYNQEGSECKHYYCYNKPVIAPFNGYVYDIINNVDDNAINEVNTINNWGNTIIINHANGLFSQLSHLKKDSFKVHIGDYVTRGAILANCGNTGRSPEPHLHFQVQLSPKIGEKTYEYPIAYYLEKINNKQYLKSFEVPAENAIISNVETSSLMKWAFDIQPGKKIRISKGEIITEWDVYTDSFNRTYIYCPKTKSTIYYANDDISFYCYDFEGNRKSLLFHFYICFYKIILSATPKLDVNDNLPIHNLSKRMLLYIQDFIAPFYVFLNSKYSSVCTEIDNSTKPKKIKLLSKISNNLTNKTLTEYRYETIIEEHKPIIWIHLNNNIIEEYKCEYY